MFIVADFFNGRAIRITKIDLRQSAEALDGNPQGVRTFPSQSRVILSSGEELAGSKGEQSREEDDIAMETKLAEQH
jgi:hypothetical protein